MSSLTNIADYQRGQEVAVDHGEAAGDGDRRKNERQIATFKLACLMVRGEAHPAILRNVSDGGAMIEALVPVQPGDSVVYWWDGIAQVEARVAWVKGNRLGLANISGPPQPLAVPRQRATRIPVRVPVRVWASCRGHWGELTDISLSGLAVKGLQDIALGTLCTIELGGQALHNATLVRIDGEVAGIRFERPLPPAKLMQLVEGEGPSARVMTRPPPAAPGAAAPQRQPETGDEGPQPPSGPKVPLRRFL
jgi:hypothetical protein|tara:strand:+ start:903 stop:1652 length:750 start_codon:yes stop_codon:yes gene_type:complete